MKSQQQSSAEFSHEGNILQPPEFCETFYGTFARRCIAIDELAHVFLNYERRNNVFTISMKGESVSVRRKQRRKRMKIATSSENLVICELDTALPFIVAIKRFGIFVGHRQFQWCAD